MSVIDTFYAELKQIRSLFHKYGKLDDANVKLDEIAKYIAIYTYQLQSPQNKIPHLLDAYYQNSQFPLVSQLKAIFKEVAHAPSFRNAQGHSIFGEPPLLNIQEHDHSFAYSLLKLVANSLEKVTQGEQNFDLLNECFGHFIRDSFRNHLEDAQYMTPLEVVECMCELALHDLQTPALEQDFRLLDPCCGVGSFLATFYHKNRRIPKQNLKYIGQDKIARMVRLSKINLFLANLDTHSIAQGNSLLKDSFLENYTNQVDLILTNPPFGARFSSEELAATRAQHFPLLKQALEKSGNYFNSEVLFIDRCLALLKPGGRLLAVVPDSVISSFGLAKTLRECLAQQPDLQIRAIIELPAVTFAQAGTRTKTSILYVEKSTRVLPTFMAQCEDIGYEVSLKQGATNRYHKGENQLPKILQAYRQGYVQKDKKAAQIALQKPSCTFIPSEWLKHQSWNPGHYHAQKMGIQHHFKNPLISLWKLKDLASFETKQRKQKNIRPDSKCISVLHVINGDQLNYEELLNYKPKLPGIPCQSGDLLISKINPHILRVLIVPPLDLNLSCSPEFEILHPITELNNYALKLLLMLPEVQSQIQRLTSGTSSSHNRIKSRDLENILLPVPYKSSLLYQNLVQQVQDYQQKQEAYQALYFEMLEIKQAFGRLLYGN